MRPIPSGPTVIDALDSTTTGVSPGALCARTVIVVDPSRTPLTTTRPSGSTELIPATLESAAIAESSGLATGAPDPSSTATVNTNDEATRVAPLPGESTTFAAGAGSTVRIRDARSPSLVAAMTAAPGANARMMPFGETPATARLLELHSIARPARASPPAPRAIAWTCKLSPAPRVRSPRESSTRATRAGVGSPSPGAVGPPSQPNPAPARSRALRRTTRRVARRNGGRGRT